MHARMLALVVAVLLLAPVHMAHAASRKITVASYNVLNLMDVFDDPYTNDEQTKIKPRHDTEAVASAIKSLGADVIAITELENEGVLRAMVNEFLPMEGYDYIYAGQTNDGRGVRTGILSRLPIVSATTYRFNELTFPGATRTWNFARDLTQVRVQASPTKTMDLFIVHFKSRRDSFKDPMSANWRYAEAYEAQKHIGALLQRDADAWVVMLGDFNDTPETRTMKLLLEPQDGKPALLRDMHASLPAAKRITYLHEPYRSTIDYILASPDLAKHLVKNSPFVGEDRDLLKGSDHAPLAVTFSLPQ